MVPSAYQTAVGVLLLALGSAGCNNRNVDDESQPPDPLVVPQSPEDASPLHMSEDEDYEEYEKPGEDDEVYEPDDTVVPEVEAANPDEGGMDQAPEVTRPGTDETVEQPD